MSVNSASFISYLRDGDLDSVRKIPKGDLHNHGVYGGNRAFLESRLNKELSFPGRFGRITGMIKWADENLKPYFLDDYMRYLLFFEASFVQAEHDGITVLEMSIDATFPARFGIPAAAVMSDIRALHEKTAPDILFRPELGLNRSLDPVLLRQGFDEYLATGCFHSIDLYGNEEAQPIENFKSIYSAAGSAGLKLKAHVGEAGSASDIVAAVEALSLSAVQHGIAAASSPQAMKFLADNSIQLNIAPESNISLGFSESYAAHQIRLLFDSGIRVTVNTDDSLLFGMGVSEQFLHLCQSGAFSAEELDLIRLNALS